MDRTTGLIAGKVGFALLGFAAVVTEAATLSARGVLNAANLFSYFTIESNLFGVAALLVGAIALARGRPSPATGWFRGLATYCMVTTGIVFSLLLAGLENAQLTAVPWDNTVLHYIMPVVLFLDWIVDPPRPAVPFTRGLLWLVYPIAYLAYSLIRGPIVGWYPYPFLDPDAKGYGSIAATSVAIAVFSVVLTWALCWLNQRRSGARVPVAAPA